MAMETGVSHCACRSVECTKSRWSKRSKTGYSLSSLLDFLFISPHCLFINQPGIVSRFPSTYHGLFSSLSFISCLSFPLLPSLRLRIRYNCCWDKRSDAVSSFCLWKQPPRVDNMEQSKRCECSLWSHGASSPQPWPHLPRYISTKPWCCHLKVLRAGCILRWLWKHLSMTGPAKLSCRACLCGCLFVCWRCARVGPVFLRTFALLALKPKKPVMNLCVMTSENKELLNYNVSPHHWNVWHLRSCALSAIVLIVPVIF